MSELHFQPATSAQLEKWDEMVERSVNGTIFHTRAFLGYHGARFRESERWLVAQEGGRVAALTVYAVHAEASGARMALSPYGASYGGFVLPEAPGYAAASRLVGAFRSHATEQGLTGFRLTHPIACCAEASLDTLSFTLLEAGAQSVSREVSSVLALPAPELLERTIASRARRNARKAQSLGVQVVLAAPAKDFWVPMDATFAKHGVAPTHDRAQLDDLMTRMGRRISLNVGYLNGKPAAGAGVFAINRRVACSFYLCQTQEGAKAQALTLVVLRSMEWAARQGYRYFDLGTSSVGMQARPNIFRFKEGFGAHGFLRETFEWRQAA